MRRPPSMFMGSGEAARAHPYGALRKLLTRRTRMPTLAVAAVFRAFALKEGSLFRIASCLLLPVTLVRKGNDLAGKVLRRLVASPSHP